jgi:hypothetical protein
VRQRRMAHVGPIPWAHTPRLADLQSGGGRPRLLRAIDVPMRPPVARRRGPLSALDSQAKIAHRKQPVREE